MNPKCANCKCYFIPKIKSSGLPYQTCEKCQLRVKNRYAFKTVKENTLEVYNMTLTTKKIVKPKVSKSGKREVPVEPEPTPEPVPEVEEEVAVEQPQEDIPFAELINEPEFLSESIAIVEKKKRNRKPKEITEKKIKEEISHVFKQQLPEVLGQLGEEYVDLLSNCFLKCNVEISSQAEIPAREEPVEIPTSSQVVEELVLPEEPAQEELLFNYDKTKVFNPATKRWCKVDSKAGKKVVVV